MDLASTHRQNYQRLKNHKLKQKDPASAKDLEMKLLKNCAFVLIIILLSLSTLLGIVATIILSTIGLVPLFFLSLLTQFWDSILIHCRMKER